MNEGDDRSRDDRTGRMAAYLAAWLVLSIAAAIAVFTINSPSEPAAGQRPAGNARQGQGQSATPSGTPLATSVNAGSLTVSGSRGWRVRTFYAVHQTFYYYKKDTRVRGCLRQDCKGGRVDFGKFEREFVKAVRSQGTGLICYGKYTNKWLNFNENDGYYLSDQPHAFGTTQKLVPFRSVFSSSPLLPDNTRVRMLTCGSASGEKSGRACDRLRARPLTVAGLANNGVSRTLWVYAGKQETEDLRPAGFTQAVLRIG